MGSGEIEHKPKGSDEMEPVAFRSGVTELAPEGSGETEPAPKGSV